MILKNWFKNIGPGPLVAAAFIGPGTVTVCTLAGVSFGFALLWAMVVSTIATIVLQEMAARLGIISQKGLAEIIRTEIKHPVIKVGAIILILSAIVIGNAAYEAGNITGAVLGLEAGFGTPTITFANLSINYLSVIIGGIAFGVLYYGNYKILERVLIGLVILMSLAFLITAVITKPDILQVLKGAFVPSFPKDSTLTIIALIGTTVVPYNLFLHASLVKEKWQHTSDLKLARKDTVIAVALGGIVSMCVIMSSAAVKTQDIANTADLAKGLEPLFGSLSTYVLGIGLFAAGITSAITAPLAAAYVTCGCLNWSSDFKSIKFRFVWMCIILLGMVFSSLNIKPIDVITFAQAANGILLPIIAGFLLWIMNKTSILGPYKNNIWQNIFGLIIVLISLLLSLTTLNKVFGLTLF